MTEQEWLACTDPDAMLDSLRGKASERKFYLFASALCQRLWWHLLSAESRINITAVERYIDGLISRAQLRLVAGMADTPRVPGAYQYPAFVGTAIAYAAWRGHSWGMTHHVFRWHDGEERLRSCNLLRDIMGSCYGRHSSVDTSWLAWNDGTIPKLTQAIYDDRAFDRLPILADALEEAGCTNADILNHCRQPGEHVRGCWVVDLLLGRS